jgi:transmembrane sensor
LATDPDRQRQFALCEIAWDLSRGPAAESLKLSLSKVSKRTVAPRRRWALGIGLAASLFIVAIALWFTVAVTRPETVRYATGAGEQRTVTLADGSRITLNTRTELDATIVRDRREVVLDSGEAFFDVVHDPSRPFYVLTSLGQVRVVGTRFGVYRRTHSLEISTEQGLVHVSSAGLPESAATLAVRPGESAVIEAPDMRPRLQPADLKRIENWRHQRLEFDTVPLADLLEEYSRYTPVPLRAANEKIGAMRVSGVFHIGDVAALSTTLRAAFGLTIRSSGSHELIIDFGDRRQVVPD